MKTLLKRKIASAFSLPETLASAAVLGIIVAAAVSSLSTSVEGVKESKLTSDAKELNSAVRVYVANGGRLDGDETPEEYGV